LSFSTSNYTLTGGSLTLQNNSGAATITVGSGTQAIGSDLFLASNLDIAGGGAELKLSGNIDELSTGMSLTLTNSSTLILSGSNDYSGGTVVEAGTLIVASNSGLLEGSSLAVGADAASLFASTAAGGLVAVPEPGPLVLLGAAVCGAAVYQRLRSRRKKQ
jgi:autotransporter-associated beta strand protein